MLAAAVLAVACTEDSKVTVDPKLTVDGLTLNDNHGVNVEAAASTVDFTVKANVAYTIVSDKEWATPAPAKVENADNKEISTDVKVNVEANTAEEARSAKISIVVDGHNELNYEFTISQAAAIHEKTLKVLTEDLNEVTEAIPADGEIASTVTLNVVSTVSWTATPEQDWITVTPASATIENYAPTSTTVKLDIAVNDKNEARTAKVTFTGEGIEPVEITVSQSENIPFTAEVKLMSITEYGYEEWINQLPDETSLCCTIAASLPVTSGYYGIWPSDTWSAELEDWESYAEETINEMKNSYGTPLNDQRLGYLNEGGLALAFGNFTPDTEYILVVVLEDEKGRTFLGYDICKTKAKDISGYTGFVKLGKYTMTSTTSTGGKQGSTTMTVDFTDEENKYIVRTPFFNDGTNWNAVYDPTAKTLTLDGTLNGYESMGNIFGFGITVGTLTNGNGFGYASFATETDWTDEEAMGDQPCVFAVNDEGYIAGLNNYIVGLVMYTMDESGQNATGFVDPEWPFGLFYVNVNTVITPATSTSTTATKAKMSDKAFDFEISRKLNTRISGVKAATKLYK